MKFQLAVALAFAAANADEGVPVEDAFAPVEDVFAPVEDAFAPVEDVFAPADIFAPEEDAFTCKTDYECQVLGDEGATCVDGRCACSSDAFKPYVDEQGVVYHVCYNPDLKVLIDVDFVAEFPQATCEEIKATGAEPQDFAEQVTAWVASEEIVDTSDFAPFSMAFCFDSNQTLVAPVVTYSAAAVDILPLLIIADAAPKLAEELVTAISEIDYATSLQEFLLKSVVGRTILGEAAARSAGVLASAVDLKVTASDANTTECEVADAMETIAITTASGHDFCFATKCNNGFDLAQDYLSCTPTPKRDIGSIDSDDDLSSGAIAALVIGAVCFLGLIVVAAICLMKKSTPAAAADEEVKEDVANEPIHEAEV